MLRNSSRTQKLFAERGAGQVESAFRRREEARRIMPPRSVAPRDRARSIQLSGKRWLPRAVAGGRWCRWRASFSRRLLDRLFARRLRAAFPIQPLGGAGAADKTLRIGYDRQVFPSAVHFKRQLRRFGRRL